MFTFFLVACGNKNEIDLTKEAEFHVGRVKLIPKKATISNEGGDDYINVDFEWIRGTNEDSMNKKSFLDSKIYFYANQEGKDLPWELNETNNLNRPVYEASKNTINAKFKLDNLKDDFIMSFTNKNKEINHKLTIELPK